MKEMGEQGRDGAISRARRFLEKPSHEKSRSIYARWKKLFPAVPFPIRLPFGAWFVGRNDYLGSTLTFDGFEPDERAFVQFFLRRGMTVLDIGAHHGFYTLLASKLVGPTGRVFAFEPSPRERKALRLNLNLNASKNVSVEEIALGREDAQATLHIAEHQTGWNSLRRSSVDPPGGWRSTVVHVARLDDWLDQRKIRRVDLIKLDVEGGELSVLEGAAQFLAYRPRPVILAELEDARSEPWGYRAKEAAMFVQRFGFRWFSPMPDGSLASLPENLEQYEGNFVAVPDERVGEVRGIG